MGTKIKYRYPFSKESTDWILNHNTEYIMEFYEDDVLKYYHRYEAGKMIGGVVLLSSVDELEEAKNQWLKPSQNWVFSYEIYNSEGVIVRKSEVYFQGVLDSKHIKVSKDGKPLASQEINKTTDAVIGTQKYYYDETHGDKSMNNLLISVYYLNSSIIIRSTIDEDAQFSPEKYLLEDDLMETFDWNEHPYYHSADPLIPEGAL